MINLINSIWEITRSNGSVLRITLLDKGYFEYENIEGTNVTLDTTYGGIGSNETWKIDGESITLSFNSGFMIQTGKIDSNLNTMEGTLENQNGLKGEWSAKFLESLKEENIEELKQEIQDMEQTKILDEVEIELKGAGNELCQNIIDKKKYLDYKNNYNDWDSFCKDSLGLDGYWEFNKVSHITGITLDEAKIKININGKTIFDGSYFSLLEEHFDDDTPKNNTNESKDYGKYISKEDQKFLITTRTLEFFNINHSLSVKKFKLSKLGFMIASTDELGYGTDYGDFLLGFTYDGEDVEFEYPGGAGVVDSINEE